MSKIFPENYYVEKVIKKLSKFGSLFDYEVLGEVQVKGRTLPIYGLRLGAADSELPVLGVFGGVHGLEKIGTHVIVNYLNKLSSQLSWDTSLINSLEKIRIVTIPIVNPGGMYLNKRSNPNGVDLMRNAPIDAEAGGVFLGSGHRFSKKLPWFRGTPERLEDENVILKNFVAKHMLKAPFSMALDIHSGFGWHDRLWYPYGKSLKPFPDIRVTNVFARYLKLSHPYHKYIVEKQSDSYMIHGDMWDYMYDFHKTLNAKNTNTFVPWTLELGSWSWLLRRPYRVFRASNLFHTEKNSDRYGVVMRKHWGLLDFFQRMTIHHRAWVGQQVGEEALDSAIGF